MTLRDELLTDPLNRGYAPLVRSFDYQGLADSLNRFDRSRPGSTISRGAFQLAIMPAVVALAGKNDVTQRKWDRFLALINSSAEIHLQDPGVQGLLGLAVQDGLLTAQQTQAIGAIPCSRAEELGLGRFVTAEQVQAALA